MKSLGTIRHIAKTELKTLFYSPVAWFLIIIMLVQSAVTFAGAVGSIAQMQEMGAKWDQSVISMIFMGNRGVFGSVMQSLYLYLPLLTMGLISREMSGGTIKLLASSPIRVREIVLGKFLSMMIMSLLMVAIIGLLMVIGCFLIPNADISKLLSGLLGLFLLLCAQSAIGLFMSCLTTYQVVAAVCTFVVIWLLSLVGTLWQGIAFVRNITYFLSISGRANKMLSGLITSKDIIYFILIGYLFVGLSILRLKSGMESKSALVKWGRYLSLIAVVLTIGAISSIPQLVLYYDATRNKENTIVPAAQKIMKEVSDAPLIVTGYANLLGNYWHLGAPQAYNQNLARWEPYMRFNSKIELRNVLYYDTLNNTAYLNKIYPGKKPEQMAKAAADAMDLDVADFKKPEEIRKVINLTDDPGWYIMQLEYKGRKTLLRVFDDNENWPSETEVIAAIKRLQRPKMPRVLFATGNLERSIGKMGDREYRALANLSTFRYSLINQGFDVDTISLITGTIPADITALVVADPKTELTAAVLAKLQQFVDAGGNLFLSVEPGKQQLVNPFLRQFGVQALDGMIAQTSKQLQPDLATPYLTEDAAGLFPGLMHAQHDSAKVSMPSAGAFSFSDTGAYTIKPLLMTDARVSWLKKAKLVADSAEVFFSPADGDVQQAFPTALQLTRKRNTREQRIVFTADADFMANSELRRSNVRTANFVFTVGLFSWLNYGEFPVDSSRPGAEDTKLNLTKDQSKILRLCIVWILPGLLIAFGTVLLIRRKRK